MWWGAGGPFGFTSTVIRVIDQTGLGVRALHVNCRRNGVMKRYWCDWPFLKDFKVIMNMYIEGYFVL